MAVQFRAGKFNSATNKQFSCEPGPTKRIVNNGQCKYSTKMRSTYIGLLVICCHVFASVKAANILSLIEVLEPDQQIWYDALFKGLIGRGHTLTVVSGNMRPTKSPHITQIHLDQIATTLKHNNAPKLFKNPWLSPFEQVFYWYDRQMKICKSVLSSAGLEDLIELAEGGAEKQTFDLILFDATYGISCLVALAELFKNVPIVGASAKDISPDLLSIARGSQVQPATVPHFLTAHSESMNFFERLHNTIVYAIGNFFQKYVVMSVQEAMLAKSEQLKRTHTNPKLENIIERINVVLVNSHPAIDYIHSLPPNVVEVGGLQFDNFNRALSVEMQTFIDNSKDGVFVITLSPTVSGNAIEIVANVIDKYPEYGFLWGVDKSLLPSLTNKGNLFVDKWLKRSDILSQRKVRGLITAGSHMEIQEAVYHGVPIIGVTDGLNNIVQRAKDLGFGISVDLGSDAELLTKAIEAIASQEMYAENAKSRQLVFRNQPQHPLDTALWWIEHVMAHPVESGYLFSQAAAETSFFVLHSLDVMAVFAFMLAMFLINSYIVLKQLRESCKTRKETENSITTISPKRKSKKADSHKKKNH